MNGCVKIAHIIVRLAAHVILIKITIGKDHVIWVLALVSTIKMATPTDTVFIAHYLCNHSERNS